MLRFDFFSTKGITKGTDSATDSATDISVDSIIPVWFVVSCCCCCWEKLWIFQVEKFSASSPTFFFGNRYQVPPQWEPGEVIREATEVVTRKGIRQVIRKVVRKMVQKVIRKWSECPGGDPESHPRGAWQPRGGYRGCTGARAPPPPEIIEEIRKS